MKLLRSSAVLVYSLFVIFVSLLFAISAVAQASGGPPIQAKLSLASGKSIYRSGEAIRLVLSSSTNQPGYRIQNDQRASLDKVWISPDKGVFNWKSDYFGGEEPDSDTSSFFDLSPGSNEVTICLNEYYRFDATGKYTISLVTKRLRKLKDGGRRFEMDEPTELTTNAVSFEIVPVTPAEEEAEAKRLGAAIATARDRNEQQRFAWELAFLPGDSAIPEKVSRYIWSLKQPGMGFASILSHGLFLTRDRSQVIARLETEFSDLSKPYDINLTSTLSSLSMRQMLSASGKAYKRPTAFLPPPDDDLFVQTRKNYLKLVLDSLPKRSGKNLVETAAAIMIANHYALTPAELANVREVLLKNFDMLDVMNREQLLSIRWEQIRDTSLIPSLEKMLAATDLSPSNRNFVRATALKRLSELEQARARPYVILALSETDTLFNDDALDSFKESVIPEIDQPLLADIRKYGSAGATPQQSVRLRHKCMLAARFATASIYDQLMDVYKTDGPKWQWQSRAILLGYFARYNETEALALVEQELSILEKRWRGTFLNDFTRVNFPPKVAEFFTKRLASDDPDIAGEAAYLISQHGSEADRSKIESRLKQWQAIWNKRLKELDDTAASPEIIRQANLQTELIMALLQGKAWKLFDDDKKELRTNCLSTICKNRFHW